eukprot:Skav220698  [mRNA]  locus=scaffold472:538021:539481:+ [translate_table: standard]
MEFQVEGRVALVRGEATLRLTPVVAEVVHVNVPRPTVQTVATWNVHSSRLPMSTKVLNSAMVTVQEQLRLPKGHSGAWTAEATERLATNLAKPKRGAARILASEDKGSKKRVREEDGESSSSDSSSSSSSPASVKSKKSATSSSSGEETKASLRQQVSELRAEVIELSEAISCHQEIEEENAALQTECDALREKVHIPTTSVDACEGRPRGKQEILDCLRFLNIPKKTILVTDGWKATKAAVKALKDEKGWGDAELWHEVVNHSAGEIVNTNGFTTDHIETRWSAVKRWVRKRSGGMMPRHNDRRKWTRLLTEFRWRKIASRDSSADGGRTWQVPLVESLTALRSRSKS